MKSNWIKMDKKVNEMNVEQRKTQPIAFSLYFINYSKVQFLQTFLVYVLYKLKERKHRTGKRRRRRKRNNNQFLMPLNHSSSLICFPTF